MCLFFSFLIPISFVLNLVRITWYFRHGIFVSCYSKKTKHSSLIPTFGIGWNVLIFTSNMFDVLKGFYCYKSNVCIHEFHSIPLLLLSRCLAVPAIMLFVQMFTSLNLANRLFGISNSTISYLIMILTFLSIASLAHLVRICFDGVGFSYAGGVTFEGIL